MTDNTSRKQILNRINEVSFAIDDLLLFLDTHPCEEKALEYIRELGAERKELLEEYNRCYGPLTIDCATASGGDTWKWIMQPFPWEQEGGKR